MNITTKLNKIIISNWNPNEWFRIENIMNISRSEKITTVRSTIQRTMQEIRDLGTIQFSVSRGHYKRLAVGKEQADSPRSIVKVAADSINKMPDDESYLKRMSANRIMRLMSTQEDVRLAEDIKKLDYDNLSDTEKMTQISIRIGQGAFREKLIQYWKKCAVTGCNFISMLRASHIKPWRSSTSVERLDLYNGLLLMPNIDTLFDMGIITFGSNGNLIKSVLLPHFDHDCYGLPKDAKINVIDKHLPYLNYHRENIFIDG